MTDIKRRLYGALREFRSVLAGRWIWTCLLAISLAAVIFTISGQIKAVHIRDGDTTTLRYTMRHDAEDILDENGIATMAFDVVDFSGFEGKMGVIRIKRAFPVTIRVDGRTLALMTTEMTVGELLAQEGIVLGEFDQINISPVLYLSPGDQIVIRRVEVTTTILEEALPYETVYKEHSLIRAGAVRTLVEGKKGLRVATYIDRVVDGVLQERELSSEVVVDQPVTEVILRGAKKPVSKLDFGIPLDQNGVPARYKKVMTNQVATGYSAKKGAYGASRMTLYDGYVAVRANEIPYGTKLYITSPDNSFVYGFAIAADTGTGLMANVIDVDLFYETYVESCLNGRKYLNIYVLE